MTKFRVSSTDKTYLKLQHFLEKKLLIFQSISENEEEEEERKKKRIRVIRQIYLYTNRYIRKNILIIENNNKDFRPLLKIMLDRSIECSSEISNILLNMQRGYDYTRRDCARFKVALKNIRYFKYIYYERKAFVATTLMVKLPSTDLCRKITDYLY
tara:strand:+ start:110 stop:577 length:468 start_codon:yes stop_codon:yes gene_type:complete